MVTIEIDGREVQLEEGEPILHGAQRLGIHIPTLCHSEWLEPYGACRICSVEAVRGKRSRIVTACNYPASDGLKIHTRSERALAARRMVVEMQLAHCSTVPVLQEVARDLGIEKSRFGESTETCILCGLCVRMCSEVVKANALCFAQRGTERFVSTPFQVERDQTTCIACGACVGVCPTDHIQMIDMATRRGAPRDYYLGPKSAIAIPTQQAVPKAPQIDAASCIHQQTGGCGICEQVCEPQAIDLTQQDEEFEVDVGQIIVTTGFQLFDPRVMSQYGYGRLDNVITSLEFEMMLNSTGPTGGKVLTKDGRVPRAIAILHCVGSRDENHHPYCSRVCCMYAMKFAHLVKDRTEAEVYQLYIDIEAYGKGYHEFYTRILSEDVNVIRGKAAEVIEHDWGGEDEGILHVRCEDTLLAKLRDIPVDMVVLCCAIEPQGDAAAMAVKLGITRSPDGFFLERHPKLDPVGTNTDGIYIAGTCQGPKDIPDTVAQAQAAAARVLSLISKGVVQIDPIKAKVDEDICSGCRVCNNLCPYQAIVFDEENEVSRVTETTCKGCGTCVAACPSGAIAGAGFTDQQIMAELEGILV